MRARALLAATRDRGVGWVEAARDEQPHLAIFDRARVTAPVTLAGLHTVRFNVTINVTINLRGRRG